MASNGKEPESIPVDHTHRFTVFPTQAHMIPFTKLRTGFQIDSRVLKNHVQTRKHASTPIMEAIVPNGAIEALNGA